MRDILCARTPYSITESETTSALFQWTAHVPLEKAKMDRSDANFRRSCLKR